MQLSSLGMRFVVSEYWYGRGVRQKRRGCSEGASRCGFPRPTAVFSVSRLPDRLLSSASSVVTMRVCVFAQGGCGTWAKRPYCLLGQPQVSVKQDRRESVACFLAPAFEPSHDGVGAEFRVRVLLIQQAPRP